MKFSIRIFFENLQVSLKYDKNVSDKSVDNGKTHFMLNDVLLKSRRLWGNVENYATAKVRCGPTKIMLQPKFVEFPAKVYIGKLCH